MLSSRNQAKIEPSCYHSSLRMLGSVCLEVQVARARAPGRRLLLCFDATPGRLRCSASPLAEPTLDISYRCCVGS